MRRQQDELYCHRKAFIHISHILFFFFITLATRGGKRKKGRQQIIIRFYILTSKWPQCCYCRDDRLTEAVCFVQLSLHFSFKHGIAIHEGETSIFKENHSELKRLNLNRLCFDRNIRNILEIDSAIS